MHQFVGLSSCGPCSHATLCWKCTRAVDVVDFNTFPGEIRFLRSTALILRNRSREFISSPGGPPCPHIAYALALTCEPLGLYGGIGYMSGPVIGDRHHNWNDNSWFENGYGSSYDWRFARCVIIHACFDRILVVERLSTCENFMEL